MNAPVYRRELAKLLIGNGISTFGNSVYLIAMILLLKSLLNSAFVLGLFQFLALIPGTLLSPLVGMVIDSRPRRSVLVVADIARAAVMIGAGAALLGLERTGIDPALFSAATRAVLVGALLLVALLLGIGNAFFVPAAQALIPSIVPREHLRDANGLRAATNQSFNLAGNAAGGALYLLVGPAALFIANGITFLLSGIGELGIREPAPEIAVGGRGASANPVVGRRRFRDGVMMLRADRPLLLLFLSQFGLFAFSPALLLALPFLVIDELGYGEPMLGLVFAASLAGGVVFFLVARDAGSDASGVASATIRAAAAYALTGAAFLALAVVPRIPVVLAAAFVLGGSAAAVYILATTAVQVRVPAAYHGRLFSLLEAGSALVAPVAYVATGAVLELLGAGRRYGLYVAWAAVTVLWAVFLAGAGAREAPATHGDDRRDH